MSKTTKPDLKQNPAGKFPGRTRKPGRMVTEETLELNRQTDALIQHEGSGKHWVDGRAPEWPSPSEAED